MNSTTSQLLNIILYGCIRMFGNQLDSNFDKSSNSIIPTTKFMQIMEIILAFVHEEKNYTAVQIYHYYYTRKDPRDLFISCRLS